MGRENNEERDFSEIVDRLLAGEEVEVGEDMSDDYRAAVHFAQKLRELRCDPSPQFKEQLKGQLEKVVAERFELIIKRKQIKYEELLRRLASLEKEVKERKNEVDILKSQKADKVKERLGELLENMEKVDWD